MRPEFLMVPCPYCTEGNKFPLMMVGAIIDRKILCSGCARAFLVRIFWQPIIQTVKDLEHV